VAIEIVPISKFKAACFRVLKKVEKTGQSILVTRKGKPIALVLPPPKPIKPESWLGKYKGKGKILGDVLSPVMDENHWEALKR
jgi:prevent-host-death family protein